MHLSLYWFHLSVHLLFSRMPSRSASRQNKIDPEFMSQTRSFGYSFVLTQVDVREAFTQVPTRFEFEKNLEDFYQSDSESSNELPALEETPVEDQARAQSVVFRQEVTENYFRNLRQRFLDRIYTLSRRPSFLHHSICTFAGWDRIIVDDLNRSVVIDDPITFVEPEF